MARDMGARNYFGLPAVLPVTTEWRETPQVAPRHGPRSNTDTFAGGET